MGKAPELGISYICGTHGRVSVAVQYEGETRMQHSGSGDRAWCASERFTQRVVREVDRETALSSLSGEDARPVCPKCGTAGCLEDKALDW